MIGAEGDEMLRSRLNGSINVVDGALHDAVAATAALLGVRVVPRRDRFEAIYLGFLDAWAETHRIHIERARLVLQEFLVADYPEDGADLFDGMMQLADDQAYLKWRILGRQAMVEVMNLDDSGVTMMKLAKAYLS